MQASRCFVVGAMVAAAWQSGCERCEYSAYTGSNSAAEVALVSNALVPTAELVAEDGKPVIEVGERATKLTFLARRGTDTPARRLSFTLSMQNPEGPGLFALDALDARVSACATGDAGWVDDGTLPLCPERDALFEPASGVVDFSLWEVDCSGELCAHDVALSATILGGGLGVRGTLSGSFGEELGSKVCPVNVYPF